MESGKMAMVERRITFAARYRSTSLNLAGLDLTALPESIGNLTTLNTLDLSGNQLTVLPASIFNITGLRSIKLQKNSLSVLPSSIGKLTKLHTLELKSNRLRTLPDSIGKLGSLRLLQLQDNQLSELPDSIVNLARLTNFNVSNNQVAALPTAIGRLTKLRTFQLQANQLSALPHSMVNLTSLTNLDLSDNQLTALPEFFDKLTRLNFLQLQRNQLHVLPESIGHLVALSHLDAEDNQLNKLPESIGSLTSLRSLQLQGNELRTLPESIGHLTLLTRLNLSENRLDTLPESIGNLISLRSLQIQKNHLRTLPVSIGNLSELTSLHWHENDLVFPPREVQALGTTGLQAFLRSLWAEASEQWVSKMLVVGEAAVGKTSVTKVLCGLPYDPSEPQTHGVHVDPLVLTHPSRSKIKMRLSVWDFGGQLEYRATQRFYLSDRSLFVLVWNSRRGWRVGGQIEEWLQAISTVAPSSPVFVVATHAAESVVDLDEVDLQRRYPRIVGFARVDCSDGTGIGELRERLAAQAALLPLMGQRWPDAWTRAADALSSEDRRHISVSRCDQLMEAVGVDDAQMRAIIRAALHDRGEILHFPYDPELADTVILQPAWVDTMITRVLDSQEIVDRGGLLSREHRAQLWRDIDDAGLREMLTALMERFDLAYRVDASGHSDIALVVERLPAGAPTRLPAGWDNALDQPGASQVQVRYKLESRQAGIPSWFIAREHRFTTGTAWSRGVLLQYRGQTIPAWALLTDDGMAQPTVTLTVRGRAPYAFFSILDEGFTGTIKERYPGLRPRRMIPCICSPTTTPCEHEFDGSDAQRALDHGFPLQCPKTFTMVDVRSLLLGLRPASLESILTRLDDDVHAVKENLDDVKNVTTRIERFQLQVLDTVRDLLGHRASQGINCPSIFTLVKVGNTRYQLQLYCEQPDNPHPLQDGDGMYELRNVPAWLKKYAPYLQLVLIGLRYALPIVGPALTGIAGIALTEVEKAQLEASCKLLEGITAIPDVGQRIDDAFPDTRTHQVQRVTANFAELRQALLDIDPDFGGLRPRQLPENRGIAYLCVQHRQALTYPQESDAHL
ncbi:hypothetical protein GCM10027176_30240 [Actinoallomurus bryophytorum]|uniref:non-specific serine/threonine protein kinase n=1 Tax=Actinoallomurus bryophytorum TaxID=1490222 RepID=A0A543CG69_9ACTN|nr:COR domain-containing protein [Actinoallomurus bryophytorum]TQL96116.1 Leucine-rich repeat (LRR) protein [Actinoallomurus bryophytorum]